MSQHVTIAAIIILALVWLAAVSLILRLVLFILGKSDRGRLAKIDSIAASVGFLPLIAIQWACNVVMGVVLILILAYWSAPQTVTDMLKAVGPPSATAETQPADNGDSFQTDPCCRKFQAQ